MTVVFVVDVAAAATVAADIVAAEDNEVLAMDGAGFSLIFSIGVALVVENEIACPKA